MKKIKSVVFVILCSLLLSGYVKSYTDITVESDRSVVYDQETLYSSDNDAIVLLMYLDENKRKYEKNGFVVKNVLGNDNYSGLKAYKKYIKIDDTASEKEVNLTIEPYSYELSNLFKVEKGFFKNKYIASYKYLIDEENETKTIEEESNETSNETISNELSGVSEKNESLETNETNETSVTTTGETVEDEGCPNDYILTVNLPTPAISNNATKVKDDKKELEWDLATTNIDRIEFSFEMLNTMNIIILCSGIILLIVIVVVVIVISNKRKRKKMEENFTPTIVNETIEGETPISEAGITSSEEVVSSIETVNESNVQIVTPQEEPVVEPVSEVQEEPVLENPVEEMMNEAPSLEQEPILNIEVPTIPEIVPEENTNQEVSNPEFVLPTMNGEQVSIDSDKEVVNPEFVVPSGEETSIPEMPSDNQ